MHVAHDQHLSSTLCEALARQYGLILRVHVVRALAVAGWELFPMIVAHCFQSSYDEFDGSAGNLNITVVQLATLDRSTAIKIVTSGSEFL
jgi:hypothetical protein